MNPENIERIVVKLGTNSVIKNNSLNTVLINGMAKDISALVRLGKQFIIVSSGAIGLGREKTRVHEKQPGIEMQQALAAVGQSHLMHCYEKAFGKHNQLIAQVLLTQENFENRQSLKNLRSTLNKLLDMNIVPIINENDVVAVEELAFKKHFSDNDMLAAKVAESIDADLFVVVSEVGGLFTENPELNGKAKLIERVHSLEELNASIKGSSSTGRGGFETKLQAAGIALKKEIPLIVTKGGNGFISGIFKGKVQGTLFER